MRRLAKQRRGLVEQSAAQRAAIIAAAEPLVYKAAAADRLLARVRRHRFLVTAIGAGVLLLGSRRIFDVAARIVTVLALFRR